MYKYKKDEAIMDFGTFLRNSGMTGRFEYRDNEVIFIPDEKTRIKAEKHLDGAKYRAGIVMIAEHYGIKWQTLKTAGEAAEAVDVLIKALEGKAITERIIDEIADTRIMLDQMAYLHGISEDEISDHMMGKVQRQLNRIKYGDVPQN